METRRSFPPEFKREVTRLIFHVTRAYRQIKQGSCLAFECPLLVDSFATSGCH